MNKLTSIFAVSVAVATFGYAQHQHGGGLTFLKNDPAIAAVLSLQPIPIDFGSFYAGNWERGILYSAAEVALFVPAMVLLTENSNWRGQHG